LLLDLDVDVELAEQRVEAGIEVRDGHSAAELELDVALFDNDRPGAAVLERIRRDVQSGMASGEVQGTPTLFIDGVVHRRGYDGATLLEALTGP
jgi:hypothetical protein